MPRSEIVLVDDEQSLLDLEKDALATIGLHAQAFTNPEKAWEYIAENGPALVVTDWNMPQMTGMDLLFRTRALPTPPHVIILSGAGTVERAVQAMNHGAFNFLEKPFQTTRFLALVQECMFRNAHGPAHDGKSVERPDCVAAGESAPVVTSPAMRGVFDIARSAAQTDSSVLLLGETGTGKEVLADFIHQNSRRKKGPMVKVNCAALPEHLLESELFGHEKGAFTGADRRTIGRFEAANGGSIFLDEIGDLMQSLQVKFLRTLQQHTVERVGASNAIPVDFRLICATHRDLEAAIAEGAFREDLFYRINVVPIRIPPLRERREDIEPLLRCFLMQLGRALPNPPKGFTSEAMELLTNFDFPGNVRQLRNAIEYALVMCRDPLIKAEHLPEHIRSQRSRPQLGSGPAVVQTPAGDGMKASLQQTEESVLQNALERNNWCVSTAAKELKMSRSNLYERLKLYGIKRP